jgi:hypothetical protein
LGLSPIPRSIDKLYRESIESAIEFWGMYQQKPAWYFNKKTQALRQNSEIHIRLFSLPPSVPRAMLLSISNANSISTTVS